MPRGVLIALLLSACALAEARSSASGPSMNRLEAIFTSLKSNNAPGAAVLVVWNGRAVFRQGYGVTDLRTLHKIDAHTNFRLASFTKQFTAACIMLLARDGKLHYDDHLNEFFPEFPAYGKSITVPNILDNLKYATKSNPSECLSPERIPFNGREFPSNPSTHQPVFKGKIFVTH